MRTMRLLGVLLVCAAAAGGCSRKPDAKKPDKPAAPAAGAGSEAGRTPAAGQALREAAREQQGQDAPAGPRNRRPAPRPTDDDNPEAPALTTMEKDFLGVREGMSTDQVQAAMDGKPSQAGDAAGGATWSAWQEGPRRFVVLAAAGRCALKGSYDPQAPDARYDRFQQVAPGMSVADVAGLLGSGGRPASLGPRAVARVYDAGENSYLVVFLDDKVAAVLK